MSYTLTVNNVPPLARGGAVMLGATGDQSQGLTAALRAGTTSFTFTL